MKQWWLLRLLVCGVFVWGTAATGLRYNEVNYLKGRTLRTAFIRNAKDMFPDDEACCPNWYSSCLNCFWEGNFADFYRKIQFQTGFEIEEVMVSPEAYELAGYRSNVTACIHGIARDEIDLCLNPTWITEDRLKVYGEAEGGGTPWGYSIPLYDDDQDLIVDLAEGALSSGGNDVIKLKEVTLENSGLQGIVAPFSKEVWMGLGGLVVSCGLILLLVEGGFEGFILTRFLHSQKAEEMAKPVEDTALTGEDDDLLFIDAYHDDNLLKPGFLKSIRDHRENLLHAGWTNHDITSIRQYARIPSWNETKRKLKHIASPPKSLYKEWLFRWGRSTYQFVLGLMSSGGNLKGDGYKPRSYGGKLIVLIFSITAAIVWANYIAMAATILHLDATGTTSFKYKDMEDVSKNGENGGTICVLNPSYGTAILQYPDLNITKVSHWDTMFDSMLKSVPYTGLRCDGIVAAARSIESYQKTHCGKVGVTQKAAVSIPVALTMRAELLPTFNYWLTVLQAKAELEKIQARYYDSPDFCGANYDFKTTEIGQLGLQYFVGLFAAVLASLGVALCEYVLRRIFALFTHNRSLAFATYLQKAQKRLVCNPNQESKKAGVELGKIDGGVEKRLSVPDTTREL